MKKIIKWLFLGAGLFTLSVMVGLGLWALSLDKELSWRLQGGWFLPPIEFYAAPARLSVGDKVNLQQLEDFFARQGWTKRDGDLALRPGDWKVLSAEECQKFLVEQQEGASIFPTCLGLWDPQAAKPYWLTLKDDHLISLRQEGAGEGDKAEAWLSLSQLEWPAERFAQYYDGQPILRTLVDLGQVPLECSQAVTAIEDADFLSHRGISPMGILRAIGRNISHARFAEGASTITQQLVKNYFLTSEKTLRRKLKEQMMAILLELRVDKDTILSNYMNVIYMGQQGVFQIRGLAAAAEYFLGKKINDLSLSECALLAAMINNPGRYHPTHHPEKALARRNLVLARMTELGMLDKATGREAQKKPLGVRLPTVLREPAPYFVAAVFEELHRLNLDLTMGLKVFTTLNPLLQERSQTKLVDHLRNLEKAHPSLVPHGQAQPLQAALLSVDVKSGGVEALVGGRQYKQNQFNRVMMGHRQPGSLFKPLVYLAALESGSYHPDSQIMDEPWQYKYEGQVWKPQNYDRQYRGVVSLTTALSQSLNIPTAKLAIEVGLKPIVDLAHRLGIQSELPEVPSLSLGAAEVTPWELTQAYLTLAREGEFFPLHFLRYVTDQKGVKIYNFSAEASQVVSAESVRSLKSMMQETFISGTAQGAQKWGLVERLQGRPWPAGKTGTTSDTKDVWFAGFTEDQLAVVWAGFDDNRPTGLTGASGALPLWYSLEFF